MLLTTNNSTAKLPGPDEYATLFDLIIQNMPIIPFEFRIVQFILILVYMTLSILWEVFVVNGVVKKYAKIASWKQFTRDWQRDRAVGVRNTQEIQGLLQPPRALRT